MSKCEQFKLSFDKPKEEEPMPKIKNEQLPIDVKEPKVEVKTQDTEKPKEETEEEKLKRKMFEQMEEDNEDAKRMSYRWYVKK